MQLTNIWIGLSIALRTLKAMSSLPAGLRSVTVTGKFKNALTGNGNRMAILYAIFCCEFKYLLKKLPI